MFLTLTPLLVADIARGTGRYNMALGAIITMQGIGGSLSGLASGLIVDHLGYSAAFLTLGAVAAIACGLFFAFVPETLALSGVEKPVKSEACAGHGFGLSRS